MKLIAYNDILKMTKEKVQSALAPARARQTRIQGELEMAKLDERIATIEQEITEVCSEHPLKFDKLIDKMDQLALIERRKKQFDKVIKELFPE